MAQNADIGTTTVLPGSLAVGQPGIGTSAPPNGVVAAFWAVSAVLDFPSMATLTTQDLTVSVPGVTVGDCFVDIALPAAPQAGVVFQGWVSAANTVTIRAFNTSGSTQDPASATYRVFVTRA